ncbi:hypothetical protein CNMCM5793_006900 [Aspergillus hiratsukae]|uniref:Uncharacterized protein n=1 Tax=Aspergillus hiratsukae TaxID=1194566 RepID=A0A8H6PHR7_9EURO|nr:hypothetical protein CNMCM5793_006900 [Aspergillus hiratsukae]
MEAPKPHGGGLFDALMLSPSNVARAARPPGHPPPPPDTPTPAPRSFQVPLDTPWDSETLGTIDVGTSSDISRSPSRSSGRSTSSASTARKRAARHVAPKHLTQKALGGMSKQFHALTNTVELHEQIRHQELEFLWGRLQEELEKRDEEHLARIKQLEGEVQELQKALSILKNPKPVTEAPKTLWIAQGPRNPRTEESDSIRLPGKTAPEMPIVSKRPAQHSQPRKTSYADLASLLATNPGGQGWQTVPEKKARKAQKTQITQPELKPPSLEQGYQALPESSTQAIQPQERYRFFCRREH